MSVSKSDSYAAAGVDVTAGYEAVNRIKPLVESTNIPGVFGAGDINHKPYRQITTAVSDGTIAALAAERWLRSRKK